MSITVFHNLAERGDVKVVPMSFTQEGLWFLDQLKPGRATYNMPVAISLRGLLEVEALERSLNAIVQRHEALRTTFGMREGQPVQMIAPTLNVALSVVDLRGLAEAEEEAEVLRLATEEAQHPFDLTQGPLLRATLLQLGAEESMLMLVIHHIVFDGRSVGVLFRELASLYEAFSTGQPSPLPELPIQYADFVSWQREMLQGDNFAEHLAYWKQQLAGSPTHLELPSDRPRLPIPTSRGAMYSLNLPKALIEALKELGRHEGVTLFTVLVAAFQTLLYRYTGQDDLLIGTVTAGRTRGETEALIGFFATTVVLRTDLSGNPTFRELLKRVRQVILAARAHQDLPFEYVVKELQPERQLGQNPLFQVMLALEPPLPALPSGWTLTQTEMDVELGTSRFDLYLELDIGPEGLIGRLEYSIDLFDRTTIARMVGHWQTLLEGSVADPTRHLSELPLLTEKEHHQFLVEWNATQAAYPRDKCIHQLFETQVERTPDAVAAVFGKEHLTYRELNSKANQLAHYLQKLGVGPEVLVGLCVERSLEMVVGLLGILKAGGAYVPLDPAFPSKRISFMLEDAQAPVLVTQQHLLSQLPAHGTKAVCLDADAAVLAQQGEDNPRSELTSDELAYVIYTSGSTGRPKGVQILHRAVVNFLLSMREQPGLTAEDSWLAITTLSFDIAALELFLPLLVGARLIVASRDTAADGAALAETLTRAGVTVMQATPITWRLLLAAGWQGNPDLKILCGGEALPQDLAQQLLPRAASLWNLYGPTETTIWSTLCKIEPGDEVISIGRPIANTQVYLLDSKLQPVPFGVPGELYIGGDGLARGYLNRPELTAERFIPHPFSNEPAARLYKTGDLARYRADGTIEHLGRLDFQIKLRGFRIELGEIEAVLAQHPAVHQAVVVAREDTPGDKRLVAYVVPAPQYPDSVELKEGMLTLVPKLRSLLKERLPDYMIPAAIVLLEALPLTPNGKVDRKALPAPDPSTGTAKDTFVAPTTPLHHQLVQIWEDLLGVRPIGIRDDFFDLGGHSLLAIRLIGRITQTYGKKLPLATLFAGATIEHLATALMAFQREIDDSTLGARATKEVEAETTIDTRAPIVAVQVGGSKRPFFYLHGEWRGGAYYSRELARRLGPDQPFYLLEPYKFAGLSVPPSFEAIAAAHLKTLRAVQPEGPYMLGGYCNGGLVAYEISRQLHAQGQVVDVLVLIDPGTPARHRGVRRVISRFGNFMGIHQDKQFEWFLCLQHIYRYLRFSHYRRLKNSELLETAEQDEPGSGHGKEGFMPGGIRLKAMVPKVEILRQDFPQIYDWVVSDYTPDLYPGKITFFWTSEEAWRPVGWQKIVKAKEGEVEIHTLPGNHITGRTEHLQVLAEHLSDCVNKKQEFILI
jgi:surfactin family lipopeptide synthetase A